MPPRATTKICAQRFSGGQENLEVPSDLLLNELEERLRVVATPEFTWFHKGRPLEELTRPLPPQLLLKEGLPHRDWSSWRATSSCSVPPSLGPHSAASVQLRRAAQSPPDVCLVCRDFEDNPRKDRWLYANSEVLGRAFASFSWRRLVMLRCERFGMPLHGDAAGRRVQLRALRGDLESIRTAHDVLLTEAGDAGGMWPFGEESRKEVEHSLAATCRQCGGASNGDTMYCTAVVLLMQPGKSDADLSEAYKLLRRSLELEPSLWAQQLCDRLSAHLDTEEPGTDAGREQLGQDTGQDALGPASRARAASLEQQPGPDEEADVTRKAVTGFEEAVTRVQRAMRESEDSGLAPVEEESRGPRVEFARSSTVEALTSVLDSLNLRPASTAGLRQAARRAVGAALEQRRQRQLQRAYLGSRHGNHLCRLRRLPVLMHNGTGTSSEIPESAPVWVPRLRVSSMEAVLDFAAVPAEGLHQTDLELCAVLWILLYYGLRRCHGGLSKLRSGLSAAPMPACLGIVRHFGYCTSGLAARDASKNLEDVLLQGLSTMRGDELLRLHGFASEYANGGLAEEDQLAVLDRRIHLLELLLATPPKVYLQQGHAALHRHGLGHRLASQAPKQTLIRPSAMRSRKTMLACAEQVHSRRAPQSDEVVEMMGI